MSRGIIDPTIGASEYGANIAQWDWKPFSNALDAAKTTYSMLRQNKVDDAVLEKNALDTEMERILFPTKQKLAELELSKMQSEIRRTDAMTSRYLGQSDADSLGTSVFAGDLMRERYGEGFAKSLSFISGIGGAQTSTGLSGKTSTSGILGAGISSF
jgi:hypothetical protein